MHAEDSYNLFVEVDASSTEGQKFCDTLLISGRTSHEASISVTEFVCIYA